MEKTAKALALSLGFINEKELRRISHKPLKVYKKIMDNLHKNVEKIKELSSKFPQLKTVTILRNIDIVKLENNCRNFNEFYISINVEKPLIPSEDDIEKFLQELEEIRKEIKDTTRAVKELKIGEEVLEDVKSFVNEFLDAFHQYSPEEVEKAKRNLRELFSDAEFKRYMERTLQELFSILFKTLFPLFSLFYLSIISYSHAEISRYPEKDKEPLSLYTEDNPIIKKFNECLQILDETLSEVDEMLELCNRVGRKT